LGPLVVAVAMLRERQGKAVLFPGVSRRGLRLGGRARFRHLPVLTAALGLVAGALAMARP
jgi:hypothetical protein